MKRRSYALVSTLLVLSLIIPISAHAVPFPKAGPKTAPAVKTAATPLASAVSPWASQALPSINSAITTPQSTLVDLEDVIVDPSGSTEELWTQAAQAEANKKLCELKQKNLREQLKLYEGPGAYYYISNNSTAWETYSQLKSQEYTLKAQKEQYEWQKSQAEWYLKYTGAKMGKAEIQSALYAGTLAPSGLSYEQLYVQRNTLDLQEQQLELQKKSLEYQYQAGQIGDQEFVNQFAALFRQKEEVKMQKDQYAAELEQMAAAYGPAAAPLPRLP